LGIILENFFHVGKPEFTSNIFTIIPVRAPYGLTPRETARLTRPFDWPWLVEKGKESKGFLWTGINRYVQRLTQLMYQVKE
jgi:hypothetical protein